ncbi:hypothetical protein PCC21_003790 [Pectobacterium carotovorum subsp. carotovorum PCC21]|nr:hypothetical protein PCC21_003790 [Pectobacterium carotovorum subsp. carotovorum PCC21]
MNQDTPQAANGLSPLTRGTRFHSRDHIVVARFIPASAGEHGSSCTFISSTHGLSPLARGTLQSQHQTPLTPRFIPAGAGNTFR